MPDESEVGKSSELTLEKVDLLHRFLARLIDFIIFYFMSYFLSWPGIIAGLTYILIADGFNGRSPGKRLIGLQVVTQEDGKPVGFKESLLRNAPMALVALFSVGSLPGWLLFFTVGVAILFLEGYLAYTDSAGQRTGDILAATRVISLRRASVEPAAAKPAEGGSAGEEVAEDRAAEERPTEDKPTTDEPVEDESAS